MFFRKLRNGGQVKRDRRGTGSGLGEVETSGGKLREKGAQDLSEAELLAILISTGTSGRSAVQIAQEILDEYGSLKGLCGHPLEELLRFKGLADVKIIRIAAAMEIGRRFAKD
jgi:DNA repair protein RadC